MKKIVLIICTLLYCASINAQQIPAGKQTKSILLIGGTAHIGNGTIIENSAIGFKDGKLILVAEQTKVNLTGYDQVIDVTGKHIYPGLIAPNITLGLTEIDAVRATRDYDEVGTINPNVRSLIAFNPESKVISTVRTNGVLMVQATPRSGLISGTSSIFALDGWNWEDAVLKADDGVHLNWPRAFSGNWSDDGTFSFGKNKNMEKQIADLNAFFAEAKAYNEIKKAQTANLRMEAMRGLFDGSKNLFVHANDAKEISSSVLFAKKYGVKKVVIVGGKDAWLVADLLKQNNVAVIINRVHDLPEKQDDDIDQPFKLAAQLQKSGVLFCLNNEGDMEAMGARNLPFQAGTAVVYGLTKEEALMALTYSTAKILGIEKKVGTIEVGKDATIIISTGDILDMRTNNVEKAYINGRSIDLDNFQHQLFEKYKGKYGLN